MRLIFPHEDHKRKYDMQEAKLAKALLGCFEPGRKDARFKEWDGEDASGCLGQELRWYMEERASVSGFNWSIERLCFVPQCHLFNLLTPSAMSAP